MSSRHKSSYINRSTIYRETQRVSLINDLHMESLPVTYTYDQQQLYAISIFEPEIYLLGIYLLPITKAYP